MDKYYTNERNIQILIYLMKAHGIKKVIASPGTTNMTFVGSLQQDSFFELYSAVDERSACYMACGMAAESGEAVALTCTGATASRNYVSGLTEAYYRKLPVLAITSTQHIGRVGQNMPQVIDRSVCMNDIAKLSVNVMSVNSSEDEWACALALNKALLELNHRGKGPVHINLATVYSKDFSVRKLPEAPVIRRYMRNDLMPEIGCSKVAVYVGSHKKWDEELTKEVELFCENYNGVVLCDATSNYKGKYGVLASIVTTQKMHKAGCSDFDLMIHIGDVSGAEIFTDKKKVWRVNPDGEIRDTFRKLCAVFEMEEVEFFKYYNLIYKNQNQVSLGEFYMEWNKEYNILMEKVPELPFSNLWMAKYTSERLPEQSILHLGILNSLRSYNFFEIPNSVIVYANTGGFGIDGCVSSLIGASLVHPEQIYIGVVGDLAFFYDLNVWGNRHIGNNVRLILVNNGRGTEFRNYNHPCAQFGEEADAFMAAGGHYRNKNGKLVKDYIKNLGFTYMTASNKYEYMDALEIFFKKEEEKSKVLEVFTTPEDESSALQIMHNLEVSTSSVAKSMVKKLVGQKGVETVKKILKK